MIRASAWTLLAMLALGVITVSREPWGPLVLQVAEFLLAAALGVSLAVGPRPAATHRVLIPLAACAFWGAVQMVLGWTESRFDTGGQVLAWGARAALAWAALEIGQARDLVATGLIGGGALLSVIALAGWSPIANRDHLAVLLEILLPLVIWRAWTDTHRSWLYAGIAGTMLAAVLAGASRAGALLAGVEVLLVPALAAWHFRRGARLAAGLAIAVVLAVSVVGTRALGERFAEADPWKIRREFALSTLEMIRARPLTGTGLGSWPVVYPEYARIDPGAYANHAHNDWLEWLAEGGAVMAALILWIGAETLLAIRRRPWAIGLAIAGVHSLVDFPFRREALAAVWIVVLMLALRESDDGP